MPGHLPGTPCLLQLMWQLMCYVLCTAGTSRSSSCAKCSHLNPKP